MMTFLFYAGVSVAFLIALFVIGCIYLVVRYSDEDDDFDNHHAWK